MINKLTKLKFILMSLAVVSSVGLSGASLVYADTLKSDACAGLTALDSSQGCNTASEAPVTRLIKTIVTILSWIVGVAAVVVIIIAGFKYATSGGDSNSIASAKHTLIYALVGLVVAALAQLLVHFAFNQATGAAQCKSDPSITASDPNCKKP